MKHPRLFKKTVTGATQYWEIENKTQKNIDTGAISGVIVTRWGQVDGKEQETVDVIREGKNIGRSNETSAAEQAAAEALSQWEKKKKKGYVESLTGAQAGEVSEEIEGSIAPMLAKKFDEHGHKIEWPAAIQPKLDGIRCIAVPGPNGYELWSRGRKQFNSCPHIVCALNLLHPVDKKIFDGELYNEAYANNFEQIASLVRKDEPSEGYEDIQYHVYDIVEPNLAFSTRWDRLQEVTGWLDRTLFLDNPIHLVKTWEARSEADVVRCLELCESQGYEGVMVRNLNGLYELGRRSVHLQKVKNFVDDEFEIIGMEEGRGKLINHAAAFVCRTKDGKEFKAKLMGELSRLEDIWAKGNRHFRGKLLTVTYQNLTADGIPRFPVGKTIRDYE